MSGRTLHIHGGFPKTGSSALQLFLHENKSRLEEGGLYIPRLGQRNDGPHHTLFMKLSGLSGLGRIDRLRRLVDEIDQSGADQILLTSEYLLPLVRSSLLGLSLRQLRWKGFDIRFHVFVRPQSDLINSGYAEMLRSTLLYKSFDEFLMERARSRGRDYGRLIRPLKRYTRAPINVIPYSSDVRRTGVYWPFLRGLGIDPGDPDDWILPGEVNPTMGPIGVHVVGRVLKRIEKRGLIRGFRNRKMLREKIWRATQRFPSEPAPFCGLDNATRDMIWDNCAEANAAFARAHWNRSWNEVFAEEREREFTPNVYRHRQATAEMSETYDLMMDMAWRATRRARRRYDERIASRRVRDRMLDPFDRLLDISLRLGMTYG